MKNQDSFLVRKLSATLVTKAQILRPPLKTSCLLEARTQEGRQPPWMICHRQQYICADRSQSQSLPSLLKHLLTKTEKGCYPLTSYLPTKFRKTVTTSTGQVELQIEAKLASRFTIQFYSCFPRITGRRARLISKLHTGRVTNLSVHNTKGLLVCLLEWVFTVFSFLTISDYSLSYI